MSPSPHNTIPIASHHLESHAVTLRSEMVGVILHNAPARLGQLGTVMLQHIDVLGEHVRPLAAIDTTPATTAEVPDMVDRVERLLGLALCT